MTAYRDESDVLRQRVEELRTRATRLEARTTPRFWDELSRETSERLEELQQAASDAEQPHLALQRLEAYLEALQRAVALAPELERAALALPVEAPDPDPAPGPLGELTYLTDLLARPGADDSLLQRCEPLIRKLDPAASIAPQLDTGRQALRARFRAQEAPFSLLYQEFDLPERTAGERGRVLQVATGVARATPALSLRPELLRHALLKPLGLTRDVQLGATSFDGMFIVDAEPAAARALLTAEVRQGLLAVAHDDIPVLEVGDGAALLRWYFEPTARSLAGAVQTLAGIRQASLQISLLLPEGE